MNKKKGCDSIMKKSQKYYKALQEVMEKLALVSSDIEVKDFPATREWRREEFSPGELRQMSWHSFLTDQEHPVLVIDQDRVSKEELMALYQYFLES